MRKIIYIIMLLLSVGISSYAFAQTPLETGNSNASVGIVKASGASAINKSEKEAYQRALLSAKRNGVEKALLRFIPANFEQNSLYLRLLSNYASFLDREPTVYKSTKLNNKLILYCDVPVNFELIQQEIKKNVGVEQREHRKDKTVFVVKLDNYPLEARKQLERNTVVQFEEAFREYNFRTMGVDSAGPSIKEILEDNGNQIDYIAYKDRVLNILKEQPEINLAVIGIVRLLRLDFYDGKYYAEALGGFEIVRLYDDREETLGKITEGFTALRETQEDALAAVTQAAAVKSSKVLADITYNSWKD